MMKYKRKLKIKFTKKEIDKILNFNLNNDYCFVELSQCDKKYYPILKKQGFNIYKYFRSKSELLDYVNNYFTENEC